MNRRLISPLLVLLLLLAFAGTVAGHDAIASCGTIQLINGTPTADVIRTDVDPDALVRDDIPGTGTQTGLAAGTYTVTWDDGFTVAGVVVTACEQVTQPTPTPTPTPPEVQLCNGPCPTPPQRIPCTSNPAVFGPPCPEPTPTPTPSPSPSSSPTPQPTPSATPSLAATPTPPRLPDTSTSSTNRDGAWFFAVLGLAGLLSVAIPKRKRGR